MLNYLIMSEKIFLYKTIKNGLKFYYVIILYTMKIKIILEPRQDTLDNLDFDIEVLIIMDSNKYEVETLHNLPCLLKHLIISRSERKSLHMPDIKLPFNCDVTYCYFNRSILRYLPYKEYESGRSYNEIIFTFEDVVVKILKPYNVKNDIDFITDIYHVEFEKFKYKRTKKYFSISMTEC